MGCFDTLRTASPPGRYSIARMCELNEYCQQRPLRRVGLVSVLTVLPSLAIIVALDAIRLQDPREGWERNIAFWSECSSPRLFYRSV